MHTRTSMRFLQSSTFMVWLHSTSSLPSHVSRISSTKHVLSTAPTGMMAVTVSGPMVKYSGLLDTVKVSTSVSPSMATTLQFCPATYMAKDAMQMALLSLTKVMCGESVPMASPTKR